MKAILKIFFLVSIFFLTPQQSEAQFFKKLKKHAEKKIEREAEKRAERRVDKKIDKEFDKAEDAVDGKNKDKGEKSDKKKKGDDQTSKQEIINADGTIESPNKQTIVWSKFDFIPGDTVIYEDGPSADEENGEFPSRWDTAEGYAEIVNVNGEPAIIFPQRGSKIVPYLKNSKEDYLPEVFTIEFDCYFRPQDYTTSYKIILADIKNQRKLVKYFSDLAFSISEHQIRGYKYTGANKLNKGDEGIWRHISIAFTKGKLKVYMDELRLINIPHFEGNPLGLTIEGHGNATEYIRLIKNIRIAKGGVKYYDRVVSDGKIIVNGIKFDVNKATLKAESMGPINKIYQLMQKQSDLNFSVEGHTDSDGGDDTNMTLSKARGKTVMDKLIAMGISKDRLKSNGFGESKPLDNNSTPEGKANNRRVEFVKF